MKRAILYGVRHPWLVLTAVLAITVAMAYVTVDGARIETNLDEYMPSDHPAFVFSDEAADLFGINDGILIAVETETGIYTNETLELVRSISVQLAEDFEEISAGDIQSLYTAENILGTDWGLEVRPFYERTPLSEAELDDVRSAVGGNEMIHGRIVSDDDSSTLIVAEIPDHAFSDELYDRLTVWIDGFETEHELHIAGRPIVEGELAKLGPADMARMAPLVIVVMAVVLFVLLRSAVHTLVNLLVVGAATIWSFGLMTVLGVPVYSVSTMIPVMLIAIGTAFGIHLHNSATLYARKNPRAVRYAVAEHAVAHMLRPVSMAAITTGIGFLALLTSQVLPVRYFGLFTAVGVLIEMMLALLLIPGAIVAFGMKRPEAARDDTAANEETAGDARVAPADNRKTAANQDTWTGRLSELLARRSGLTLAVAVVVVLAASLGITRVWVDTSFLSNFEDDSAIVRTDEFVNEHFPGTSSLNIILSADREDAFKEPAVLDAMGELQRTVEDHEYAGDSFALTDYLKRMHRVMHEDREEYYAIPDNQELIAQYLLLYEMSGDPDNLNAVVDYGYETANITVQLKSDSSAIMEEVIAMAEPSRQVFADLDIRMDYAGSGYKSYVFADLLLTGQMWSLLIAFGIVALLLALVFRDAVVGIIGIVPIAITAVVNFGVMGLLDIPLSSATAIISSIAIGIGVDYAIHFIEQFKANLENGSDALTAVTHAALSHSGRAILFNAIAVMGGFAVLAFSLFPPNRQVGGLIALNMATSAVGTLTVLPVLLMWYYRRRSVHRTNIDSQGGIS